MNGEPNQRLAHAMHAAGLTPAALAEIVDLDEKSILRWLQLGRTPHARNQWAAARALATDVDHLWPPSESAAARDDLSDGPTTYSHRGKVPAHLWTDIITGPTSSVRVLVYSGLPWFEANPAVLECLRRRADEGVAIHLALGDPDCAAVALRGQEEGIDMAARVHNALRVISPLVGHPGIEIRLHSTTLHASLYMNDHEMLANQHIFGTPASQAPIVHVRKRPDDSLFDRYARSFASVWGLARPYLRSEADRGQD